MSEILYWYCWVGILYYSFYLKRNDKEWNIDLCRKKLDGISAFYEYESSLANIIAEDSEVNMMIPFIVSK